ncbi:MAG: SIS domain-containing protein [Gemmatimonadota bacterium]
MIPIERVGDGLRAVADLANTVRTTMVDEITAYARLVDETLSGGGTLFFCGNGGSAADAQHLAAEYVVRLDRKREPMRALALTTDTSVLSAAGNDYGFDAVFERQLLALGREGDLLVLHSTSGESENLVRAARAARARGLRSVGLLARGGGRLADLVDLALVVPTESTSRAQEMHLMIGHLVCEVVEFSRVTSSMEATQWG